MNGEAGLEITQVHDAYVESALYEAAIGGNVDAIIFWLKNRMPEKWGNDI